MTSPNMQEAREIVHALECQGTEDDQVAVLAIFISKVEARGRLAENEACAKVLPKILDEQFGITLRNTTDLTEGVIEALIDNVVQAIRQRSSNE